MTDRFDRPEDFKEKYDLDKRREACAKMIGRYPKCVPIILCSKDVRFTRAKYVTLENSTVGKLMWSIRSAAETGSLREEESVFVMTPSGTALSPQARLGSVYSKHKDSEDGLLYLVVTRQNTFG